jgi:hypothetical protein
VNVLIKVIMGCARVYIYVKCSCVNIYILEGHVHYKNSSKDSSKNSSCVVPLGVDIQDLSMFLCIGLRGQDKSYVLQYKRVQI